MRQSVKTLVLWVVLIVAFTGFYAFFANEPRDARPQEQSEQRRDSGWQYFVPCALVIFVGIFAFRRTLHGPWAKANERGNAAFARGRHVEALEEWKKSAELAKRQPLPLYNAGVAALHLWRLREARALFEKALALPNPTVGFSIDAVRSGSAVSLLLLAALEGRGDEVKQRLEEREKAAQGKPAPLESYVQLAKAVQACREGRFDEAHTLVRGTEVLSLGSTLGAFGRALASWCVHARGGPLQSVDRVAMFSEGSGEDLRAAWPEFAAFLDLAPQT